MKKTIIIISLLFILGAGLLFTKTFITSRKGQSSVKGASANTNQLVNIAEVPKHTNMSSCWMIIDGKVYDLTKFISQHPGGNRILQGCGKDATSLFNGTSGHFHSQIARSLLKKYLIGDLSN